MSVDTLKQDWQEVQEITLMENGQLTTGLDKLVGNERLLAIAHNFKVPVFFDYKISVDGGTTFYPPHQITNLSTAESIRMYADNRFLYFDYYNSGGGIFTQVTWRYRLFVLEVKS